MNYKHASFCLSLAIIYLSAHGMDQHKIIPMYILHKSEYENFRFTRLYGEVTSSFDSLPTDIVEKYFKQPLITTIIKKFKHRLLNHKYQKNNYNSIETLEKLFPWQNTKEKIFYHHDGTYNIVPDIGYDYAMRDERNNYKKAFIDYDKELVRCLHSKTSKIILSFPIKQCLENNRKNLSLAIKNEFAEIPTIHDYISRSTINHCLLSNDGKWLVFGTSQQNNNVIFFNLDLLRCESKSSLNGSISALCAAHHSPLFIACSEGGDIAMITPDSITKFVNDTKKVITNVQFSPDDSRFFSITENTITLYKPQDNVLIPETVQCSSTYIKYESSTRKAFFSPDGKIIAIALENGNLSFMSGLTGQPLLQCPSTWRCADVANIDNQAPLILWSTKNNLIFSLDPADHTDPTIYTCVVRGLSKGRLLTMYNFYPDNPKVMGLTKDENTVVFVHTDNSVSLLHLYDNKDKQDIDFIEKKANIYQLCQLLQICKDIKVDPRGYSTIDANATQFINAIRSFIASYQ